MPKIDFYTIKGVNLNRYFELGLDDDTYYRWYDIVDKVEDKIGCEEDELMNIEKMLKKERKREGERN